MDKAEALEVSEATPGWLVTTLEKLEDLTHLDYGWDSYGGLPLQPEVHQSARRLLGTVATEQLPVPNVVLCSAGTVQLEWRLNSRELEVELLPGEKMAYVRIYSADHMEEGEVDQDLPAQLRDLIRWLRCG